MGMTLIPVVLLSFICIAFPSHAFLYSNDVERTTLIKASSSDTSFPKIKDEQIELPTGVSMQVMSSKPERDMNKPVLLFLHGSFHAAWCWSEKFFPYFVSRGYPVVAPSWRGTGGTFAGEGIKKVQIQQHVADLEALLDGLPKIVGRESVKPIVICHSFGSLAIMKCLELNPEKAASFGGIVMICGVPPSGNGKMTMRYLRRSLKDSWKITAGFAMKRCLKNAKLCRQLFFGGEKRTLEDGTIEDYGVSDDEVAMYQKYFARDSEATIDLVDLAKQLPSAVTTEDGKAPFVDKLPPCLVMGGVDDFIVDREGVEETARYFGLSEPVIVDSPHDVMLGRKWENAAKALEQWLIEIE